MSREEILDLWRDLARKHRREASHFHGLSIQHKVNLAKAETFERCVAEITGAQ